MRIWLWITVLVATFALAGCSTPDAAPTAEPPPTVPPVVTSGSTPMVTRAARSDEANAPAGRYWMAPPIRIDVSAEYIATIRTDQGNIKVELFPGQAPTTVNSFVFLANQRFFDGLIFHRVIQDFMIQGGDPTGTGTGGPGYQFPDEIGTDLSFNAPGVLASANTGVGTGTNGSQFFVTTVPVPHLTGNHTIFGQVIEGQDVVDGISRVSTDGSDRPLKPVTIEGIDIVVTPRS